MQYVCVSSRYLFFNSVNRYTVEYSSGLREWFVFNDEEHSGAVFTQKASFPYATNNRGNAENILMLFLAHEPISSTAV